MARMFCRHNRLTANCPICRKELEADLPKAPPRASARSGAAAPRRSARTTARRPGAAGVVTRRLARAADDGYRNALVPGCKATADAERLAAALVLATARLEHPGPFPEVAAEPDPEQATWTAFLLVLGAAPGDVPPWAGDALPDLPDGRRVTAEAYRPWAVRNGGQAAVLGGDASWTPQRRFARAYERLSLPQFTRHDRVEFLLALAAAGLYDLAPDSLFVEREDDAATAAAKRLLVSGDRGLLDRRARDLVGACEVPFGALEHALARWDAPGALPEPEVLPPSVASALRID